MNILVIGGSGLVGGNVYRELKKQTFVGKLTGTHYSYPLPDTILLNPLLPFTEEITATRWDVIIHTGALTHVDKCEQEPALSHALTVQSTANLLQLAQLQGALFVYLSTDYLFDGEAGPYTEEAAVNPLSIYGQHKLEAELLVHGYPHHLIARITNVYGEEARNKNFVAAMRQRLQQQQLVEITAPCDQYATPVNAADVARALVLLIKDKKRGVYHLAGTDYLSRTQLLQRINKYYDNRILIHAVTTVELKQPARRPLRGGLLAGKFMADYPYFIFSNIDDYLKTT